ncbi:MAG TPA: type IV pilus secretin PilQ [Myxococcales bacterium]|nr:type IV pilus secretin PilQ [Myxococcales bacterium]
MLTFLARESGVNIIAGGTVSGTITIHLKEVPWDLALDMILKSKGLDYVVQDGVYRVAPVDVIQKEFEREVEKRKKMTELKRLVVRLVTVNYADANDLKGRVKDLLSKKGTVSTDTRTNTLIVKDIEEHVIAAEDLVRRLDTETPQVLIEARIVEASSNFSKEVGIQWGGNYVASPAFGNETGLLFPGIIGVSGAADDTNAPTSGLLDNSPNFAVNLPAAVGGGKGGGIGLSLGTLSGSGNISLRLSAAEERGTVKIISSPRIATLDNTEATIQQGISIPISVVSSLGVNTQFFNAQLSLKVKPHVTQDGNVNLDVHITKNEPNFSQTGASGAPTIERKEAKTQLLVRDGDTAVIGGIYTRNSARSFKKVPILGDIPFLGWLFKSRVESDKRSELLLFITPRIINRAASRVRVD